MATAVNQNYPGTDDLTIVDETNAPIEGAEIRVYTLVAFEAGSVSTWVGMTTTDAEGHWIDPLILEDGQTWVVHIQKTSVYGPTHVEITT